MSTDIQTLKLDQIRINGDTQPRVAIDEQVVAEYAKSYRANIDLPPVTVFFDGVAYWLADGFHRYWATKQINREYVFAEVHPGTLRDAIVYSVGANATHGLRRTTEDKRKAVLTLLNDEDWSKWTDREIAKKCGVSHDMVNRARRSILSENDSMGSGTVRTFVHHKTGKPTTMKTAKSRRTRSTPRCWRTALPQTGQVSPHSTHLTSRRWQN